MSIEMEGKFRRLCHENRKCEGLEFSANFSDLTVEEIGDGNLNDVLRIRNCKFNGINSTIVKQGPPYIKCLGPEYPLTVERNAVEYSALVKYDSIVPGCVPKPRCRIPEENLYFMEDLEHHEVLRRLLIKGVDCEDGVLKLAEYIAVVHNNTIKSKLSDKEIAEFKNEEMVSLTKQFVFTAPFVKDDHTNRCTDKVRQILPQIYDDQVVLDAAARMRTLFLEKSECLVHGDLHTGSVMCTTDGKDPKMMDLEFAYVGPRTFDVGMFIANLIFTYYQHMSTEEDNDTHRQFAYSLVDTGKRFIAVYLESMTSVTDGNTFMLEVTGFCGCEIIRRIVGTAHVEDFDGRELAEADALGAGIRLLRAIDRIDTADRLMVTALMLA